MRKIRRAGSAVCQPYYSLFIGAQYLPAGDMQFALFFEQTDFPDDGLDPQPGHVGDFLASNGHHEMLLVAVYFTGEFGFEQIDCGQDTLFGLSQVERLQDF